MRRFCSANASLIFATKNISVVCYNVVKHLTSWPLNKLVKLTMLWTTGPWLLYFTGSYSKYVWCPSLRVFAVWNNSVLWFLDYEILEGSSDEEGGSKGDDDDLGKRQRLDMQQDYIPPLSFATPPPGQYLPYLFSIRQEFYPPKLQKYVNQVLVVQSNDVVS